MAATLEMLCFLLIAQLVAYVSCQADNAQTAEDQTKLAFQNQRQYFGYPLSRAFPTNRGAQQFTPVTEEASKEQQFFNSPNRQEAQDSQQLQDQQNALLLQYAQQQYLSQQAALGRQQYLQPGAPSRLQQEPQYLAQPATASRAQEQQQYSKAAEQYPSLLGVRFSAAPTVAKTQFSGNGFSFTY